MTDLAPLLSGHFAAAVEGMTGEKPEVKCEEVTGSAPDGLLWWQTKFSIAPDAVAWAGAAEAVWTGVGSWVLGAAGIETSDPADARNTWFELLSQSASSLARDIGQHLETEVSCSESGEAGPPVADAVRFELRIKTGTNDWLAYIAFSRSLVRSSERQAVQAPPAALAQAAAAAAGAVSVPGIPKSLDLLMDVELPVSVSFGRARIQLKEVLKLTTGTIVELNRMINEPVEVLVNNCVIARGEVVVIDGNYGVRIQEIVSREQRMRSLR